MEKEQGEEKRGERKGINRKGREEREGEGRTPAFCPPPKSWITSASW